MKKPSAPWPFPSLGLWLLIAFASTTCAKAESPEKLAQLAERALALELAQFPGLKEIEVRAQRPASAQKLKPCRQPIEVNLRRVSPRQLQTNVQLICSDPAWRVSLIAEIRALQTTYRAKRLIAKGETLEPADFIIGQTPAHQVPLRALSQLKTEFEQAIAARDITPHSLLTLTHIDFPILIEAGQEVTLVFKSAKLQIKTQAIALSAAKRGESLQVRNLNSNKILTGFASERGVVVIP
jgi:flagella basal body P-ring formation protein FlgA